MTRRGFLAFALASAVSCSRETRCKQCGMKIDPASAFRAELVDSAGRVTIFDTPKCALTAFRTGKVDAREMRVLDYYDRTRRDAREVLFVVGGDVLGPMGPDFVPVDPGRATKFIQDHGADHAYRLDEIDAEVLARTRR